MPSASTVFVDTNVLLYAQDPRDLKKRGLAELWLAWCWRARRAHISTQVLNELYANLRRVAPQLPVDAARALVRRYRAWNPWVVDETTVDIAWQMQDSHSLSYWDALMLAAARQQGCRFLLTEDLQHDQSIDGIRIVNPFLAPPDIIDATRMTATLTDRLARTLRQDVQGMHAYAVQPSAGLVKVDTMENPFRLPEALQRELGTRLGRVAINRYPAERTEDLRAALAVHAGMPDGCALTLGNGSDEIITMLGMACDVPGAVFMAPLPGFVMYGMSASLQGIGFVGVPLTADFELDEAAMLAAIDTHRPALIYLAYPNNPTANLWDAAVIERIVQAAPGLVVMDEAYQPFAARDSMDLLARYPQVLVMRTMSKFGLAGVRIGYLMGRRVIIDEIDKLRPPFNVSVLNAEAALFALDHVDEYARQAAVIRSERERLQAAFADLPGARPYPSDANMILVRVPDAARAFAGMKQRGVLVKNVSALHPLLANCLRVTVGTPEENLLTIAALKASL